MRLAFVSHSFPPAGRPERNLGGMQRVAYDLWAALAKRPGLGLHSYLLRTSWRMTHVRVGPFLIGAGLRLHRAIRRGEIDAVLFSSMVTAALALPLQRAARRRGVALAAIAHGRDVTLPSGPYQRLLRRVFAALDRVLPVSNATGAACLARGLPSEKLRVLPNGIDPAAHPPPPSDRAARRAALPPEAPREAGFILLSVGRQVRRKGFEWFVRRVMPALPDDVHYVIAGEGPEGPGIRAAVAELGLSARVHLLGRVSAEALAGLYRGADVFVMPNIVVPGDMEGFGVVMLEAGLGGLPSVGANLEGIADVIADGQNGRLAPTADADAFRERILEYYHDPALLAEASASAARYVAATFSWDRIAARCVGLLAEAA